MKIVRLLEVNEMVEKLKSWWKDNVESVEKILKVLR
jgi:hypothetical protein